MRVVQADYGNPAHAAALVGLLDAYACDAAGGGRPLSPFARSGLVGALASRPTAFSVLAYEGETAVGLANCFEGFSTFACKPLVNVHDLVVLPGYRGRHIGARLLEFVERLARGRGACKLTLEVLQGNRSALRLYERAGFAGYQLGQVLGTAQFMQKWLDVPLEPS